MLPPGTAELVASARKVQTIAAVPTPAFTLWQQDLALIGASAIVSLSGGDAAARDGGSVLVFAQAMDLSLLGRAGVAEHIENLHFLRGGVPPGYQGCEIAGLDGRVIGSLVWRDRRSGDAMLWN